MAMEPKDHAKLLGIFFLITGGMSLVIGLIIGLMYGGMGVMFMASGEKEGAMVGGIFLVVAVVVGILLLAIAALHLNTGWKLFKGNQHAKTWAMISSILVLLNFPLGTALGIYGLWFITGDLGKAYFSGNTAPGTYTPPPPPNSWQQ